MRGRVERDDFWRRRRSRSASAAAASARGAPSRTWRAPRRRSRRPATAQASSRGSCGARRPARGGPPASRPPGSTAAASLTSCAVCESILGILRETRAHDAVQRRRRHRRHLRDRRRVVPEDRGDERRLALARRTPSGRWPSRRATAPKREDVDARVGLAALELLGRHVLERAEHDPALGQRLAGLHLGRRTGCARDRPRAGGRERLGEAEVEELDARLRQHDVAGLEVAVDDPLPVRLVERVGDLDPVAQDLVRSAAVPCRGDPRATRPRGAP